MLDRDQIQELLELLSGEEDADLVGFSYRPNKAMQACNILREALRSLPGCVAEGYKLVPIKPTPEMKQAIEDYFAKWQRIVGRDNQTQLHADCWSALQCYSAMLAAAPGGKGE